MINYLFIIIKNLENIMKNIEKGNSLFDNLLNLQSLLKKESSIKELCKKKYH